ncbi:hypothetical protein ACFP65_09845 [Marinilactibacillus sp. GCM10026970]|uniref:hypothetical protein n=1 Tax=Marinilactibacillus sp. GCM10026970 TaxID=3252642 RepID=UPI00360C2F3C
MNEVLFFIVSIVFGAVISLLAVTAVFCIPVLLEEKKGYTKVIKTSLDKGLSFILYSVSILVSMIAITFLFLYFPYLLIGLSVSLPAVMISLVNAQIDRKETFEKTKEY